MPRVAKIGSGRTETAAGARTWPSEAPPEPTRAATARPGLRRRGAGPGLRDTALVVLLVVGAAAAAPTPLDEARRALARGDAAWDRRAEGHEGLRARPGPTEAALGAYAEARRHAGGTGAGPAGPRASLRREAEWKLLRALWFAGEFVETEATAKRARTDRALSLADEALRRLEERAGRELLGRDEPRAWVEALPAEEHASAAQLLFWSAIHWGVWTQTEGLLSVVREGVAGRMRRRARAAEALAPETEGGGPQRLLSRLHADLPRVPFLTGWVERDLALRWAERALAVDPEHPGNAFLLATALLDVGPEERGEEAVRRLEALRDLEPRPGQRLEDLLVRRQARERLEELRSARAPADGRGHAALPGPSTPFRARRPRSTSKGTRGSPMRRPPCAS